MGLGNPHAPLLPTASCNHEVVRNDSVADAALLIPVGLFFMVAAIILWSKPDLLARGSFPFNWLRDASSPRRWIAAAPFGALGVALIILGVAAL